MHGAHAVYREVKNPRKWFPGMVVEGSRWLAPGKERWDRGILVRNTYTDPIASYAAGYSVAISIAKYHIRRFSDGRVCQYNKLRKVTCT